MSKPVDLAHRFIARHAEKEDMNQYWYAPNTIEAVVEEIQNANPTRVACISTPSIYFALPAELRRNSVLLDFDAQWESEPHFVKYDFKEPENIPKDYHGSCDFVVVDPPFITQEVWEKYAEAVRMLGGEGVKILCSTIAENAEMMHTLMNVNPLKFLPGIPHLVYQYKFYANYEPTKLGTDNPLITDTA